MDELAQLKQQVAELTKQVQGVAAERNELRQRVQQYEAQPAPVTNGAQGGHPFAGLMDNPQAADQWLQSQVSQLIQQQGFISQSQLDGLLEKRNEALQQQFGQQMEQYIRLYHGMQDTLGNPDYAGLKKWDDPLAQKTREIAQAQGWAKFNPDAKDWLSGTYNDLQGLSKAARMAKAEMAMADQAGQAASASGQAAQAAAGLSAKPSGAAPAQVSRTRELMQQGADASSVLAALEQETPVPASV